MTCKGHQIFVRVCAMLMTLTGVMCAYAQKPAGITADRATLIADTMELTVQSGGNYIRINNLHLPATITYFADTAFGPIPEARVMNDVVPVQTIFADCKNGWRWEITEAENTKIVEIRAHENALLLVEPYMCPTDKDTIAEAWDSITWRGNKYTENGDYQNHKTNERGCEWIETLHLTIHHTIYDTVPLNACNSITHKNKTYTESGLYIVDTTLLEDGNRQVNVLSLTINHATTGELTVKQYEPYTSDQGNTYNTSGDFVETISNAAGCDSTITLHVTIYNTTYTSEELSGCESVTYKNNTYTETSSVNDTIYAQNGDREIKTVNITVRHTTSGDTITSACESFKWYGRIYKSSGDYTHKLTNAVGCDSIVTLHLTINQPTHGDTIASECNSFTWYGTEYQSSGDYTYTKTNVAGCDSIITLHLTVSHPTAGEEQITRCLSYTSPRGNTYTESGDYTEMTTNKEGCDSTITIHLTLIGDCTTYDTIYFCHGLNTQHDERVSEELVRRYLPYRYESPSVLNYMDGVVIERRADSTLMDLNRAEGSLRAHYVKELTPIDRISWSVRYRGSTEYVLLASQGQPQWVAAGQVAIQVQFLCGEVFNNAFSIEDIDAVGILSVPTKRIENGQVIIIRGGERYTVTGLRIR